MRLAAVACLVIAAASATTREARAETTLANGAGWEVFSNGRVNAFQSYANGDAFPVPTYDPNMPGVVLHEAKGGGLKALAERPVYLPPDPRSLELQPGTIEGSRVRSGFVANIFGFGLRRTINPGTTVTAYIAIWAVVESEERRKYRPVFADVREGYLKVDGPWGSFLAGRSLVLFNRGGTTIDYLYGHGYGLGFPGSIDVNGPAAGQIGFGLLANGFGAGLVYATPPVAGLQLTVGYYDPSNLVGTRLERTKWGRPEAELTFERPIGASGKIVLFGNGAWQKLYQGDGTFERTIWGAAYGGRFELGPLRLGFTSHMGEGLGLSFAFDPSEATVTEDGTNTRFFTGYYGQMMLVFGRFSISGGAGITYVSRLSVDRVDTRDNDNDPATNADNDDGDPTTSDAPPNSYTKSQFGVNAGIYYRITDYLVLGIDYFRADFKWWQGERQLVNFVNSGITMTW
jgi:hypothetical protein